ncbi:MAG: ubiquinol-cytochrome c reductase iron-sulfur subunit [Acidimicrobiia bacterium]|nr:ubiquinol-cytochrome c reductase iron-sulfur subunit [Acidimicrobiia bacterium]MDH3518173.1 ubiquinol-cytochrome c reductase iron-sulfur subunit [Acidimicrobiia bacterium]
MKDETADSPNPDNAPPGERRDDSPDPSRRKFLTRGIAAIGGGIAAGIGVPAVVFVTGSARTATADDAWIRLGSASSVEAGAPPTLMKAKIERRSGYLIEEQEVSVFVTTENGADFTVLSNVCTHLGCRVRWVEDQNGFFCPCHNAIFDQNGAVTQGPPPRPLDRFEAKVEDGQIFFKEA